MDGSTVLVIGYGASVHVISEAYERSPQVGRIIVAPGNDFIPQGMEREVIIESGCDLKNLSSILNVAEKYEPDLVDVVQEGPLALGIIDKLSKPEHGFTCFGPLKNATWIEANKRRARKFMKINRIPSPEYMGFYRDALGAKLHAKSFFEYSPDETLYIKASGLCEGKGALKAVNLKEASEAIGRMKTFGKAGEHFLVEKALKGKEFSYFAITDGENYHVFNSAQDYKRALDGDEGEQTGGMGAVSPSMVTKGFEKEIERQLISKTISGLKKLDNPYRGILYAGGMMVGSDPFCIEDNIRWGDPECQVVLPALQSDYFDLVLASIEGRLNEVNLEQDDFTRVCVVGAAKGYPDTDSIEYKNSQGKQIFGLEEAMKVPGVKIYGAGIKSEDGKFYVNGGRLFSVVGRGRDVVEARDIAYGAMNRIRVEGDNYYCRRDIAA